MSDSPEELQRRIADLEAQLRALQAAAAPAGDTVAGDKVGGDKVAGDKVVEPRGTVNVADDARINGVAVGVNLGTIIYGRPPGEDERRRLVSYLDRLAAKLYRLPLRGLDERLDQGDGVALPQVYVLLATTRRIKVARGGTATLRRYYTDGKLDRPLKDRYHPEYALPDQAIIFGEPFEYRPRDQRWQGQTAIILYRSLLATEAVQRNPRLIILGDPGSGKSTFLRHLAWALAQRGLDQAGEQTALFGWNDQRHVLPIILPLRLLAGRLASGKLHDVEVHAALRDEIASYGITQVDDLLNQALDRNTALILFDGLDEVPLEDVPGQTVNRTTILKAIRLFAQLHRKTRIVVTCRTRAFDDDLRALLDWPVEMIAPFTLGQVRHFVPAWYGELVIKGQITQQQAARLQLQLIDTIVASPKLRAMAETPLLLTMMALVLYNKGELPRDRPQLYERILELLLGQWDKVRDGRNLAEAIGLPDWDSDRIRPLLDRLSYVAHLYARSEDGRGRIDRSALYTDLIDFFRTAHVSQPWETAGRCLDYFEHRSGLLIPDESKSYVFAHLTLQEHCAGRHIALGSDDPVALIMQHRADDRWREPIFLGAGLMRPAELNALLADLIDREASEHTKPVERWYRDLILATEIGRDRDWNYLRTRPMIKVERLQHDLRAGLVALLADKTQPLPVVDRVRAGFLLGDLGDPRFPLTIDDWRRELAKAQAGDTAGYFCRVEAGTYTIGSSHNDPDASDDEKPQHAMTFDAPFWVARFPITNAQWQAWVEQGGGRRSHSAGDSDLNRPNQPVTGVNWHMCNDFCAWLSEQLGVTVRLPSEFEWEAAARGGDGRRYPWGDAWQDDRAAMGEDQETRGARYTVPVGCYPAGAAPCGALDTAGNVWEWTANVWRSYPGATRSSTNDRY